MNSRSETVRKEIATPFKEGAEAVEPESLKLSLVGYIQMRLDTSILVKRA